MDGWTPLHLACFYNKPLILHLLLAKGANLYHKTRSGQSARELTKDKDVLKIIN